MEIHRLKSVLPCVLLRFPRGTRTQTLSDLRQHARESYARGARSVTAWSRLRRRLRGEYKRDGILGGPARDRELAETIGREIVLALIVEDAQRVAAIFSARQTKSKLKTRREGSDRCFFRRTAGALARAQNWNADDRRQFRAISRCTRISASGQGMAGSKAAKEGRSAEEEAPVHRARCVAARSFHVGAGAGRGAKISRRRGKLWLENCCGKRLGRADFRRVC